MKRYLVAAGVGTMVFGAALGSASALQINDPGVAQFGESYDLVCDDNGVSVAGYKTETDEGDTKSYGVVVTGISDACDGKWLVAEAMDENGNQLSKGAVQIDSDGTADISWGPVFFVDLDGVQLTIG